MRAKMLFPTVRRGAVLWTSVAAAYFLWEALAYRGIYGRLAELQIGRFGAYAPFLTYVFLLILAVIPVLATLWLVRPADPDAADAQMLHRHRIAEARRLRTALTGLAVTCAAVSVGFVAYASLLLPGQDGKLRTIAVSEVGSVPVIPGPARVVGGELGTIVYFGHDWYISDQRMAFAPYRAPSENGGVSRLFVELDGSDRIALGKVQQRPVWSGIIVEGGLPGPARTLFGLIGVEIADQYYTLYRTEYALKVGYWLQAIQWIGLAAFLFLLSLMQARRLRRLEREHALV